LTPLLVAVLIATPLVSCKSAPTKEPTEVPPYDLEVYGDLETIDPRSQVVVFWYSHSQGQEETLLALVDEFNTDNEWNITVIAEYAGSTDALYDKIRSRIESSTLPEIVVAERHQAAMYAKQDALVALDPYVESEEWGYTRQEQRDFSPIASIAESLPQFEDRYDWPLYKSMEALYYNEDRLTELGYTEPPKTWEEFKDMACAASDPEAETYGYEFSVDAATFADMLFNRGGQMINKRATAYTFGGDEGLEVLTSLQEILNEGCAIMETERFGDRADFGAGKVLFTISSVSNLPHYHSAVAEGAGFNWSISPLPTSLDTPRMYIHGPSFSILRATPEKQLAAWLFLKWFTEPEQQARWTRAINTLPIRASAADLLEDDFAENPLYERAFGLLKHDIVTEPGVTGYGECRDVINEMLTAVANLEDPATWLADTARKCNDSLK
jgi:multiple sugar transport system substrate-binding protein